MTGLFTGLLFMVLHMGRYGTFLPPLNAKDEAELLERKAQGDVEAKKKLVEHNLRLVAHIIKKYYSAGAEQDDLISIGTIGLIKAVNSFDVLKGARLATYAARCIENEILMYFRNQKKSAQDISISEPIETDSEGNPLTLIDIISVDDTIVDDLDYDIRTTQLKKFVSEMEEGREKQIIFMRYGLGGKEPMTQKQVAAVLGISRSYVSRIEKKALETLRARFG